MIPLLLFVSARLFLLWENVTLIAALRFVGTLPSFIFGKHTHNRLVLRRYQQDAILRHRVIVAFGLRNIVGETGRHRLQRNVRRQLHADIRIERNTSRLVPECLVNRPLFVAKYLERVGERDQLVVGGILLREFRWDGVGVCRRPRHRERAVDERGLRRLRLRSGRLLSDRGVKTRSKRQYRKNHSHSVPPLPCGQWSRAAPSFARRLASNRNKVRRSASSIQTSSSRHISPLETGSRLTASSASQSGLQRY